MGPLFRFSGTFGSKVFFLLCVVQCVVVWCGVVWGDKVWWGEAIKKALVLYSLKCICSMSPTPPHYTTQVLMAASN